MDWNEALSAVQDNPEYQALVKKLAGGAESTLNKEGSTSADVMNSLNRQSDIENATSHMPAWNKSAADSADVFNQGDTQQGFKLVGEPTSPDAPNFDLQGKPYGSNLPAVRNAEPELVGKSYGKNYPSTELKGNNLPAIVERDVTPDSHGATFDFNETRNDSPTSLSKSGGLSPAQKIALGVGAAGTGAIGYEALKDDTEKSGDIPPPTEPTDRQPAGIPDKSDKEKAIEAIASKEKETTGEPAEETSAPNATAKDRTVDEIGEEEQKNFPPESESQRAVDLDFGNKDQNKSLIDEAIKARQQAINDARFQRGIEQLSGGLARINPNYGQSDIMQKQINVPIENYQLKQQAEESDPNSGISMGMRDYIKRLGINVSEGATAAQLKSVVPMIYKDVENKQAQAAKSQDLALKQQALGLQKQQIQATRDQTREDKLNKQSQDQANKTFAQAESVRGNKAIQNDMETIRRVQNAMGIVKQYKDPNAIPQNILNILNTDLATIAGGGVPGEGLIHEVATPTVVSKFGNSAQQFLNHPVGANAAAFVAQNEKLFNTLASDAQGRLQDRYRRIGNTMGHDVDPNNRENFRRQYLPNDVYDKQTNDFVPTHKATQIDTSQYKSGAAEALAKRLAARTNRGQQ